MEKSLPVGYNEIEQCFRKHSLNVTENPPAPLAQMNTSTGRVGKVYLPFWGQN